MNLLCFQWFKFQEFLFKFVLYSSLSSKKCDENRTNSSDGGRLVDTTWPRLAKFNKLMAWNFNKPTAWSEKGGGEVKISFIMITTIHESLRSNSFVSSGRNRGKIERVSLRLHLHRRKLVMYMEIMLFHLTRWKISGILYHFVAAVNKAGAGSRSRPPRLNCCDVCGTST